MRAVKARQQHTPFLVFPDTDLPWWLSLPIDDYVRRVRPLVATVFTNKKRMFYSVVVLAKDRETGKLVLISNLNNEFTEEDATEAIATMIASGARVGTVSVPSTSAGYSKQFFGFPVHVTPEHLDTGTAVFVGKEIEPLTTLIANYDRAYVVAASILRNLALPADTIKKYDVNKLRTAINLVVKAGKNADRLPPHVLRDFIIAIMRLFVDPFGIIDFDENGVLRIYGVNAKDFSKVIDLPQTVEITRLSVDSLLTEIGYQLWAHTKQEFLSIAEIVNRNIGAVTLTISLDVTTQMRKDRKHSEVIKEILEAGKAEEIAHVLIRYALDAPVKVSNGLIHIKVNTPTDRAALEVLGCAVQDHGAVCDMTKFVEKLSEYVRSHDSSHWKFMKLKLAVEKYVKEGFIRISGDKIELDEDLMKIDRDVFDWKFGGYPESPSVISGVLNTNIEPKILKKAGNYVISKVSYAGTDALIYLEKDSKNTTIKTFILGSSEKDVPIDELIGAVLRATHEKSSNEKGIVEFEDVLLRTRYADLIKKLIKGYKYIVDVVNMRKEFLDNLTYEEVVALADVFLSRIPKQKSRGVMRKSIMKLVDAIDFHDLAKIVVTVFEKEVERAINELGITDLYPEEILLHVMYYRFHRLSKPVPLRSFIKKTFIRSVKDLIDVVVMSSALEIFTGYFLAGYDGTSFFIEVPKKFFVDAYELVSAAEKIGCAVSGGLVRCPKEKLPKIIDELNAEGEIVVVPEKVPAVLEAMGVKREVAEVVTQLFAGILRKERHTVRADVVAKNPEIMHVFRNMAKETNKEDYENITTVLYTIIRYISGDTEVLETFPAYRD